MQTKLPEIPEEVSQHQPLDSVYVSNQIKVMDTMLDENLNSQMNTMKIVERLSEDIVHMQKNMNDMQQLLSSLIENQEVVSQVMTHIHACIHVYPCITYVHTCIHMHTTQGDRRCHLSTGMGKCKFW